MACVNADGTVTVTAQKVLQSVSGGSDAQAIAALAGVPLYRARASLRELVSGGFLEEEGGGYVVTAAGQEALNR